LWIKNNERKICQKVKNSYKYSLIFIMALCSGCFKVYGQVEPMTFFNVDRMDSIMDKEMDRLDTLSLLSFSDSINLIRTTIADRLDGLNHAVRFGWLDSLTNPTNLSPGFLLKWDSLKGTLKDTTLLNLINEFERRVHLPRVRIKQLDELRDLQNKVTGKITEGVTEKANRALDAIEPVQNLPTDVSLEKIENMIDINQNNGELPDIREWKEEVNNISDIDHFIEGKAEKLDEIQELNDHKAKVTGVQEAEKYLNPSFIKRQALQKSYMTVTEIDPDMVEKLNGAMAEMEKYKKKYHAIANSKDVDAGSEKPIKGRPVGKHWIYGTNFQMNPGSSLSVDISPLVGYRFNDAWTIGTGGSVRYALDAKENFRPPNGNNIVFGFRAFNQYRVIKSIFIHAEWEAFNEPVSGSRDWKHLALAGIGKEFTVTKGIKAQMIFLYNFNTGEKSPYTKPVVFRFGFMRKKDQ
jgi:hypothetical protein